MKKTVTIKMNEADAYAIGLLRCACLHPINNHYDSAVGTKYCSRCTCMKYAEIAVPGEIIAREPMKYRPDDVMVRKNDGTVWEMFSTVPKMMTYMLLSTDPDYGHGVMLYVDDDEIDDDFIHVGRL